MSDYNHNPFNNNNDDEGSDSQKSLSSYSDLFVAISFVFLFLFITANIQNGISQMVQQIQKEKDRKAQADEIKKINENQAQEVRELITKYEKIITAYQVEKNTYLKDTAPKSELEIYEKAISKLKLIEEEKFQKKEEYEKLSKSFDQKAQEYQTFRETLSSIIDANLVIKKKIAETQDQKDHLEKNLSNFKSSFKKKTTAEFNKDYEVKVSNMEKQLDKKFEDEVKEVKKSYDVQVKQVQTDTERKIASIQEAHQIEIKKELDKAQMSQDQLIAKKEEQHQAQIEVAQGQHQAQIAETKEQHQAQIAKAQGQHKEAIDSLENQKAQEAKQFAASISAKEQEVKHFQDKLAFSKVEQNLATKDLASTISKAFKDQGVDATVNLETGEVTLNFEKAYFKMGSHKLNKAMRTKLRRVLPVYADAVFKDKAKLERIENFEIIGYSSPVFGRNYINPKELSAKNYWPLNYNLDLSYRRARSVFKYIFNPYKVKKFTKKQEMFQMTKVSGRSYLEGRIPASMPKKKRLSWKKYCKKYDCNGQQKVVIKFNLKY